MLIQVVQILRALQARAKGSRQQGQISSPPALPLPQLIAARSCTPPATEPCGQAAWQPMGTARLPGTRHMARVVCAHWGMCMVSCVHSVPRTQMERMPACPGLLPSCVHCAPASSRPACTRHGVPACGWRMDEDCCTAHVAAWRGWARHTAMPAHLQAAADDEVWCDAVVVHAVLMPDQARKVQYTSGHIRRRQRCGSVGGMCRSAAASQCTAKCKRRGGWSLGSASRTRSTAAIWYRARRPPRFGSCCGTLAHASTWQHAATARAAAPASCSARMHARAPHAPRPARTHAALRCTLPSQQRSHAGVGAAPHRTPPHL